ncbi:spindle and centriole-associated protein [Acrasis kona]|uniref:Spindle and centriole-associated protein n=1 Tax=Acrasis kona TaxID=1008807 RepID=A0AAW2ZKF9_9EUKA
MMKDESNVDPQYKGAASPGASIVINWSSSEEENNVPHSISPPLNKEDSEWLLSWKQENSSVYSRTTRILGICMVATLIPMVMLHLYLIFTNIWALITINNGFLIGITKSLSVAQLIMEPLFFITCCMGILSAVTYLKAAVQLSVGAVFCTCVAFVAATQMCLSLSGILLYTENTPARVGFIISLPMHAVLMFTLFMLSVARLYSIKKDMAVVSEPLYVGVGTSL